MRPFHFAHREDVLHATLAQVPLPGAGVLTVALPVCGWCARPVHRMTAVATTPGRFLFTVFCHGRHESVAVPKHLLKLDSVVSLGVAFSSGLRQPAVSSRRPLLSH